MPTSKIKIKLAEEEYDRAISLMQYHTQLLWQEFGVFLLADTVLIGFLGSILVQDNTLVKGTVLAFGGAILGLLLCFPWWTTYWHNYKYYELRIAQARRHEKLLGISLLTEGKELSSSKGVKVDGINLRHSFFSRHLPPRVAMPSLIFIFGGVFVFLSIVTYPL